MKAARVTRRCVSRAVVPLGRPARALSSSPSSPAQPEVSPFAAPPEVKKAAPAPQNPIVGQASGQWRVQKYSGGRSSVSGLTATVFGCTGFLGRYVVNILGRMGSQVVTPYRGEGMNARHLKLSGDLGQIVPVPFNLYEKETVLRTMARSNVVINLIGGRRTTKNFDLHDVNVKVPLRIAQLAREAGVERLIHVSALGATSENPVSDSLSDYLKTKSEGEAAVRAVFPEATIIRPGPVFGPEDKFLNRFAAICRFWGNETVRVPMFGNEPYQNQQPIHCVDVAQAIFNSISDASTQGKVYDLGGLDIFTGRELYDMVIKDIYRKRDIVYHSELKGRLLGAVLDKMPQNRWRMWTPDMLKTANTDLVTTCKAGALDGLEAFGISDPRRLESTISNLLLRHRGMFGPRLQGMTVVNEQRELDVMLMNHPDFNPEAAAISKRRASLD